MSLVADVGSCCKSLYVIVQVLVLILVLKSQLFVLLSHALIPIRILYVFIVVLVLILVGSVLVNMTAIQTGTQDLPF